MAYQFQFRGGTTQEWEAANPILAEREIGVVSNTETGENNFIIGDGVSDYLSLSQYAFGASAYDVLRKHGGYKGTIADFCRQLDNFTRYGEQQVGQLTNAGAGWNSFTFPQEFSEEVYVTLTPVDCPCYAVVRNVTKQGFFYCLYTHDGNTTANNETANWNACTVSELNLAHAMAQAAGLNPFDYDNLTQLFAAHAAEVVANEAAMRMVNNSSMASGRYLCHLAGLNPDSYVNVFSIAKDIEAMNTVCQNEDCITFINGSAAAKDSIKRADIGITKYALTLAGLDPTSHDSMVTLCENVADITAVAASATAMEAVAASATSLIAIARSAVAINYVAKSSVAKDKLTAKNELLQQQRLEFYNTVKNNSTYFTLSRAQKDDDGVSSADIKGANYIVFAIPCSYGTASSSKLTTMFHGHNGTQVIQRYGAYTDENFVYIGLGGATFTEQGDGMVRTWVYTAK